MASGGRIGPRRDLLIEDGRITASAGRGSLPIPATARRIDGRGAVVLPGLVDAHAHLDALPRPTWCSTAAT